MEYKVSDLEANVADLREEFEYIKPDWIDLLYWSSPHKVEMLLSGENRGQRNNNHIVNPHHLLSRRAFVSGFMEGNTSSTRQWGLLETGDDDLNQDTAVKEFTQSLTSKVFKNLSISNIYRQLPLVYEDVNTVNTSVLYVDELPEGKLNFTPLDPGTYYLENDYKGDAVVLVRCFRLTVRQMVMTYGKKKDGEWDWSNFSKEVKNFWEKGKYSEKINVVEWCGKNEFFDADDAPAGVNRPWVCLTYETDFKVNETVSLNPTAKRKKEDDTRFLRKQFRSSRPFVAPKNASANNFAYGQTGCMLDSLGLVKSLNKKTITRDINLDFMAETAIQGMAGLKKTYRSNQAGTHLPMSIYEQQMLQQQQQLNLAKANGAGYQLLTQDTMELTRMIDRLHYADYLLYMVNNPKTRTAREVDVVEQEKQLIAGPLLQSLDQTLNVPLLEYVADYALRTDPSLIVPDALGGKSLQVKITSVFAQVQRAADLPQVDRYITMMANLANVAPGLLEKVNFDKYADIYADRLYLPAGLNREQSEVDAQRERQQAMQQREMQLQQAAVLAKAQKDNASAVYDQAAAQGDYAQ